MSNIWNATDDEMRAAKEIKNKLFKMVEEKKECLNDKNFRQQIKAMFGAFIIMADTEPDKSDSDRLLYDLYNEICKYTKWRFTDYENMMTGIFY